VTTKSGFPNADRNEAVSGFASWKVSALSNRLLSGRDSRRVIVPPEAGAALAKLGAVPSIKHFIDRCEACQKLVDFSV